MAVKGGHQDKLVEKKGRSVQRVFRKDQLLEPICSNVEQICICILLG